MHQWLNKPNQWNIEPVDQSTWIHCSNERKLNDCMRQRNSEPRTQWHGITEARLDESMNKVRQNSETRRNRNQSNNETKYSMHRWHRSSAAMDQWVIYRCSIELMNQWSKAQGDSESMSQRSRVVWIQINGPMEQRAKETMIQWTRFDVRGTQWHKWTSQTKLNPLMNQLINDSESFDQCGSWSNSMNQGTTAFESSVH